MDTVHSSLVSDTTRAPAPRGRRWWLIGGLATVALVVAVYFASQASQPHGAPADLDYSTTRLSEAGLYQVTYTSSADTVPVNQLHTWTLHVTTPDGQPIDDATISVAGDMPEHKHGMPTRPEVTQNLGNGDYLVEGMKFQMGGWWVVDFTISANGQTDKVSFNLSLQE